MTRPEVPELAIWLTGKREADRLRGQGVELTPDQAWELGQSLVEHAAPTDPAELAALLEQVKERNRVQRQLLATAPEAQNGMVSEQNDVPVDRGLDQGVGQSAAREQEQTPDRNAEIEHLLAEARDDDHDWS